jgi:hypothetical protein
MDENNLSVKKVVAVIIAVILSIVFLEWLINYLTIGKLVVTTNSSQSTITVSSLSKNTTGKGFSKQATGSLSIRLKAGGYFVAVEQGSSSRSRYVTVRGHVTTRLNLTLPAPIGVEPVTFGSAQDIAADSSSLVYLNPDDSNINQINGQDQVTEFGSSYSLQSIRWADPTYGVGQNAVGQLFVISNGTVNALQSPVSDKNNTGLVYAITPDREIYIGLGSSVYSGTETGGFKKIYAHRLSESFLLAGSDRVAILSSGYGQEKSNITVVNKSGGGQVDKNFDQTFNGWSSWSPDNKYLVVVEGAKAVVLNSSLRQVATIPQNNIAYPDWLNSGTLFYSINDQLWSYNVATQDNYLVANMPLADSIKEVVASEDGAYIYLVTVDSSGNTAVRRVGLHGQKVPSYIYKLQDILPQSTPGVGYSIGLVNFSGPPTIQVVRSNGGPMNAQQLADQVLQSDGFDTSKLRFEQVFGH